MAFNKAYGAGLINGSIRTNDGVVHDIEAIIEMAGTPKQNDVTVDGDDTVKAVFSSNRVEDMKIIANAVDMDAIQAITGNALSSSNGGSQVALGTTSEMSPPFVEVSGQITAVDGDTNSARVVTKTWHKVQLRMTTVTSSNGKELSVEFDGTAYQTTKDILGVALASTRVATLNIN